MKTLQFLDYLVIGIYFAVIAVIGVWVSRGQRTTSKYFVADRSIPSWAVAFTLMATMISSGSIVASPGTVYEKGMILLLGHFTLPFVLIFVAFFIVPFYRHVVKMSAYEYLNQRFGPGARLYSSLGFLLDRAFDLGVTLVTTAIPIHVMTGWDIRVVIVVLGLFTVLYTCLSGIEGVVWTNAVQGIIIIGTLVLILGTLLFSPSAGSPFAVVGEGWRGGRFHLGSFDLSWSTLFDLEETTQWLFLVTFIIMWGRRYMADQHMVQRYLIARSDREARQGALWGAISCVPIWVACMFIGACLYGYYQLTGLEEPELADHIVPHFLVSTLPAGIVGLILAGIMAASMSSVSADLNSVATVMTTDYFAPLFPRSADRTRLLFGRLAVLAVGVLTILMAWLLIPVPGRAPLLERAVTIGAILSGGVLGLFLLGFATRRATRTGCNVGIIACLLFTTWGILTAPRLGETGELYRILDIGLNFPMKDLLVGVLGHVVLFVVGYGASLLFGGKIPEDVERLTIYGEMGGRASDL